MPYLGNVPAEAYTNTVKDSFNGDASTTAFTLSQPSTTNNLRVVVENVIQDPTVAYTVSGTTLTFTSAPPVGTANIYAVHLGPAAMTAVPPSEINNATNFTDGITVDKDGAAVITADRASSDGTIIDLQKDGSSIGTLGIEGGDLVVDGGSGHVGVRFMAGTLRPRDAGTVSDGGVDLGASNGRWQDLYLYGGVYLGGIGSANLLDDYETGTWTPVYKSSSGSHPTITYSIQVGVYVKIGDMVHVQGRVRTDAVSGGGGFVELQGLPFTNTSPSNAYSVLSIGYCTDWTNTNFPSTGFLQTNNTAVRLIKFNTSEPRGQRNLGINVADLNTTAGDNDILFSMTYKTD